MADVDEILAVLEDVEDEDRVKDDIYSNLVRLYKFASEDESTAEDDVENILSEEGSLEGLSKAWGSYHESVFEAMAYQDAIDHLQKADSLAAFAGKMRQEYELEEGAKKDYLRMIDDPDYQSPAASDSVSADVSRETVEEMQNEYEIVVKTAIEPVVEGYGLES